MTTNTQDALGFAIDPPTATLRCIREVGGGVYPATDAECALWDALSAAPASEQQPMTDDIIKDIEFAVAIAGRAYPERAEAISKRLTSYRALLSQQAADSSEPDWKRFALAVIVNARDNLGGDVDGGMVQDVATECGLLVKVEAKEPCDEDCVCVGYGDFPHDCYRYSRSTLKAIAAQSQPQEGDKS